MKRIPLTGSFKGSFRGYGLAFLQGFLKRNPLRDPFEGSMKVMCRGFEGSGPWGQTMGGGGEDCLDGFQSGLIDGV